MSQADDQELLAASLERNAAVVTLDADFHTILAVTGAKGPSAIRVRIQGLNALAIVGGPIVSGSIITSPSRGAHALVCVYWNRLTYGQGIH